MTTKTVGVRQLKNEATRIVREVREHRAEYVITVDGKPVARLTPLGNGENAEERRERIARHVQEAQEIGREIAAAWKSPLSAAEAVAEQRREL